jgi:hypothetical protein
MSNSLLLEGNRVWVVTDTLSGYQVLCRTKDEALDRVTRRDQVSSFVVSDWRDESGE